MTNNFSILTINPGSTSTKISLFQGKKELLTQNISHKSSELAKYKRINDEYEFRKDLILTTLEKHNIDIKSIDAVVGRGGLLKPIPSGTYEVSSAMLTDLKESARGEHASNLGGILAHCIATTAGCKSYITDPVVVDEMNEIARISGNPNLPRISIFHALNHKSVARHAANLLDKEYSNLNLIIAHMGGGISIGMHEKGKVIDVNNALDGDGPFSPERSGGVPSGPLAKLCFSGKFTEDEIKKQIKGAGGFVAYFNTNNAQEIQKRYKEGDPEASIVYQAMAYQISKEIGQLATTVSGKVDAIVLTGGLANSDDLIELIKMRVSFIAKVLIFPGEKEMEALRDGALRVLCEEESAKTYQ